MPIEQFGGADGELAAAMRYFTQGHVARVRAERLRSDEHRHGKMQPQVHLRPPEP